MSSTQMTFCPDSSQDYPLVPSTEEHRRLDEQNSALNELMFDKISHAPLKTLTCLEERLSLARNERILGIVSTAS